MCFINMNELFAKRQKSVRGKAIFPKIDLCVDMCLASARDNFHSE